MTGWRRAIGSGVLLVAVYVGLSFLSSPRGFLGTDTGGKVATLRVMTERETFDPDLGYWAEQWDPEGALHPIALTSHLGDRWVNVTTLPALWVGWQLYRVGGYRAALLVPMAGAVAAAYAAVALSRRLGAGERHAWWSFWLVGLASPLTVYALDFWEHSLGVALLAWAMVLLVDVLTGRWSRPWTAALLAGLLFGAAATLRTEALVYLAVAGLALLVFYARFGGPAAPEHARNGRRLVAAAVLGALVLAGALVPLLANEVLERLVVGSTVRGSRIGGTALGAADAPAGRIEEAAITVLGLEGSRIGIALGALSVALLVFAVTRTDGGLATAAVAGAAALAVVRFASGGLGFVPGLGPAWVLPAAAVITTRRSRSGRDPSEMPEESRPEPQLATGFVAVVALAAVPLVLATQFRGGAAPQWAGRYLLLSGFLLAVLGWTALERRAPRLRVAMAALAAATTVAGVAWLALRSHDVDRAIAALEARTEPVLVSDVYHLAREGARPTATSAG